jgi:hypothetical protein
MNKPLVVICCSVLCREIEAVLHRDCSDTEIIFIDSMLHMHPEKLHQTMEETLSGKPGCACLIVYGDCHAYMKEIEKRPHCARTRAVNCSELLLGQELYKKYRNEKTFLFFPEWTVRWREIFQQKLGFSDPTLAREFMQENRNSLVYLDTGISPVPEKEIQEIAVFFGMPVQIIPVSLKYLQETVASALKRLEGIIIHGS